MSQTGEYLSPRLATAEARAQTEIRRREKAERKLDRALETLDKMRGAAFMMSATIADGCDPVPPKLAGARRVLRSHALDATMLLRNYGRTAPTPDDGGKL